MSIHRLRQSSAPVGRIRFEPPIMVRNCCQYGLILSAETAYFNLTKHTVSTGSQASGSSGSLLGQAMTSMKRSRNNIRGRGTHETCSYDDVDDGWVRSLSSSSWPATADNGPLSGGRPAMTAAALAKRRWARPTTRCSTTSTFTPGWQSGRTTPHSIRTPPDWIQQRQHPHLQHEPAGHLRSRQ